MFSWIQVLSERIVFISYNDKQQISAFSCIEKDCGKNVSSKLTIFNRYNFLINKSPK